MNCPTDEDFAALIEGTLSPEQRRILALHAETCEACRELMGSLQSSDEEPEFQYIGRYQLLNTLGSGAMGVVYAAFDTHLERRVALKVLRRPDRPDDRDRLVREAKTLAQLTHPNVVAVYEVGEANGVDFIAMEFVDGVTLQEWLAEQNRPKDQIIRIFCEAGRGLAAAHRAGIVHRDFKPGNVLVGNDGRVRVGDFGLAKEMSEEEFQRSLRIAGPLSSLTQTGVVLGTPAYMSPEQHRGRKADAKSDQFSFCVALYEALYDKRPFRGGSSDEVYDSILQDKVTFPFRSGISRRQRLAITQGLHARPETRHPSMLELLALLESSPNSGWNVFAFAGSGCGLGTVVTTLALILLCCGGTYLSIVFLSAIDGIGGPPVKDFFELRADAKAKCGTDPLWPRMERMFQREQIRLFKGQLGLFRIAGLQTAVNKATKDRKLTLEEIEGIEASH